MRARLEDKIARVEEVLRTLNADTESLRRLMAWDWVDNDPQV